MGRGPFYGDVEGGAVETVCDFENVLGEFFADVDAEGDADQVGVFEFNAGALVAVVEQDVNAGARESFGKVKARGVERDLAGVGDRDNDLEGGDGSGEGVLGGRGVGLEVANLAAEDSMAEVRMRSSRCHSCP